MKFIQKSRIETFLKSKGYSPEVVIMTNGETKYNDYWFKTENEKVVVPRKDIMGSDELTKIFKDKSLLNEFRKL